MKLDCVARVEERPLFRERFWRGSVESFKSTQRNFPKFRKVSKILRETFLNAGNLQINSGELSFMQESFKKSQRNFPAFRKPSKELCGTFLKFKQQFLMPVV